ALLRLIRGLEGQGGGVLQRLQVTGVEPALQPCTVDGCWRSQSADALHTPLLTLRIAELQYGGSGPCLGIVRHALHNALQVAFDAVHHGVPAVIEPPREPRFLRGPVVFAGTNDPEHTEPGKEA